MHTEGRTYLEVAIPAEDGKKRTGRETLLKPCINRDASCIASLTNESRSQNTNTELNNALRGDP